MKQRLIGAIVLGCLAIIFLPILLDGEGVSTPALNTTIPVAPTFPEPLVIEPQRPVILSDTEEIQIASDTENDTGASASAGPGTEATEDTVIQSSAERPALDAEGLPQAWSIRMGLFSDQTNAESLIAQLIDREYRAYSDQVMTSRGELTAVFVGPVLTRTEAEALRAELSSGFNLEALVVDFNIGASE